MTQLNLLPDVKMEYLKAQRSRRLVSGVALLASAIAVGLLVLLITVGALQKHHLSDLNKDISSDTAKLQAKPDINKILTVQNQLQSLTGLHSTKPATSRLFDYLNGVTPVNVSISSFTLDLTKQSIEITGTSDSLSSVNTYIDTLKFTTYTTNDNSTAAKAFNNIVLSSFSLTGGGQNPANSAAYSATLSYDPAIFDITKTVKLSVPKKTTTRSDLTNASDLFQASSNPTAGSH